MLDAMGLKLKCDKASKLHDYLRHYEVLFQPLKDKEITLLEIGVCRGNSIWLWEQYFSKARIIGMDIDGANRVKGEFCDRVTIETGDQNNKADLRRVSKHGPFDIIIDDGSHICVHQIKTFGTLWHHVRPGGWYIIEDLETSMRRGRYVVGASQTTVDYLAELQSKMHDAHVSGKKRWPVPEEIESMLVVPGFVAMRRGVRKE
jgi:demethylmacrocin O-methyltransferase